MYHHVTPCMENTAPCCVCVLGSLMLPMSCICNSDSAVDAYYRPVKMVSKMKIPVQSQDS